MKLVRFGDEYYYAEKLYPTDPQLAASPSPQLLGKHLVEQERFLNQTPRVVPRPCYKRVAPIVQSFPIPSAIGGGMWFKSWLHARDPSSSSGGWVGTSSQRAKTCRVPSSFFVRHATIQLARALLPALDHSRFCLLRRFGLHYSLDVRARPLLEREI